VISPVTTKGEEKFRQPVGILIFAPLAENPAVAFVKYGWEDN
jgi:hypothetical protein